MTGLNVTSLTLDTEFADVYLSRLSTSLFNLRTNFGSVVVDDVAYERASSMFITSANADIKMKVLPVLAHWLPPP